MKFRKGVLQKVFRKKKLGIFDLAKRISIFRGRTSKKKLRRWIRSCVSRFIGLFGGMRKRMERVKAIERRKRFAVLGGSVVFLFAAGFAIAGVIDGFSTGDINKGLVGHWPLDGEHFNSSTDRVDDISGHGNHGTNSGAALTIDRHGQANSAMSFVRTEGDNINCGTLIDSITEYSVSLWAKANTIDSGAHDMLISDVGGHWWYISINGARWFYRSGNGSDSWGINNPVAGTWYHIVIMHNGSSKYLYIDGVDQGVVSASTIDRSSFSMEIGKYSGSYPLWNGSIADVRAYDRALSEPEIEKLYETYKPKFSVGSANKGLVGHYSFDNFGEWTENLAPYVDYSNRTYEQAYTANSWGGDAATIYYYEDGGYKNLPYKKMIKTVAGTGGSYLDDNQYITIEDNKTYAISAWMKASRNQSFNGHLLNINRDSDNTYRVGDGIDLTTAWERYSWIYNSGTGHAGEYQTRHIIYIDDNLPLEVYWSGFQIEEKDHITPFVDGTRDDYAKDNSGYASHAALDGSTPTWVEEDDLHQGVYEFFKGEQKRIQLPDPYLGTKTISFWVKVKEGEHTSAERVPFLVYNDGVITGSGDTRQILLCMQSNTFRMHGWGSGDPSATSNINDGEWHHLVWHMNHHATDANQRLMNMWVDGTKEVTDFNYSQGSFGPVADSYWWVGYNSRSYSSYLRDSSVFVDDIRFYDRALSDGGISVGEIAKGEIGALYTKGRSGSSVGASTMSLNKGLVLDIPLTLEYTKDETVGSEIMADTTPYGNDGQNYGANIGDNSASFATTGEYIRVLDNSILRPYNDEITFSLWVNPTAWATNENILTNGVSRIYHRGDWSGDILYFLYRKDEYDSTGDSAWSYYAGVKSITQLDANTLYHIVGVRNGDNLKIFVNGEKERDLNALENQTPYTSFSVIDIGKYNGQVSNVKIYNRALSPAEVKLLYDKGR